MWSGKWRNLRFGGNWGGRKKWQALRWLFCGHSVVFESRPSFLKVCWLCCVVGVGACLLATRPASVDPFLNGLQHGNVLYLRLWAKYTVQQCGGFRLGSIYVFACAIQVMYALRICSSWVYNVCFRDFSFCHLICLCICEKDQSREGQMKFSARSCELMYNAFVQGLRCHKGIWIFMFCICVHSILILT